MFLLIGVLSLVMPLMGLVLIVWAALTVWRAISLPRHTPRTPACEICKFPVADLPSFTCPECGADLRKSGITTPAAEMKRRGSLALALVAWTFLVGTAAYAVFIIGWMFVGMSTAMTSATASTSYTNSLVPHSGSYRSAELVFDADWASVTSTLEINLALNDGSLHWIKLDPGTLEVLGLEEDPVPWSSDVLLTWFADLGLDSTDPQTANEADEITRIVDMTLMSPMQSSSISNIRHHSSSFSSFGNAAAPATPWAGAGSPVGALLALAATLLIYVLGIVFIVARRRKLLQSTRTPATA